MALTIGLEPTTDRLTADCSTIELSERIAPVSHRPTGPCGQVVLCQIGLEWLLLEALRIIKSFLSHDKEFEQRDLAKMVKSGKRNRRILMSFLALDFSYVPFKPSKRFFLYRVSKK